MATEFNVYTQSAKIPNKYWDNNPDMALRSKNYFTAIEEVLHKQGIHSYYVCTSISNNDPILFQFHIYDISLWELLGGSTNPDKYLSKLLARLLSWPKLRLLICGNLLISGSSGIWQEPNYNKKNSSLITSDAIQFIQNKFKFKIGIILFKDLTDQQAHLFKINNQPLNIKPWTNVICMAPLMSLSIKSNWDKLDDYADDLKSKYRSQYMECRQKMKTLIKKPISHELLNEYKLEIDELYTCIYNKAKAKGPYLGANYFESINNSMPNSQFNLIGYFSENKLIAINSRFIHENTIFSSFFGIQEDTNERYALFKNMLFDDLEYAIVNNVNEVNYGRTTYDMKSAIGTTPITLSAAVIPLNWVSRWFMPIAKIMLKQNPWQPRSPFRSKNAN